MTVRIGTSGWSYDHWTDVLYPPRTPPARRLQVPAGFAMTVKAPRGLTHARRLRDPEQWVEWISRGWDALGDKAYTLLVQLQGDHERDDARLDHLLGLLPRRMPAAVELRHPSWDHEQVYALLKRHGASYVVTSGAGMPCVLRATSQLVYVRMHGPDHTKLYAGSYSDDDLHWWAARVEEWLAMGHDVVVYFNNDGDGNAVRNARTLAKNLNPVTSRE